MEPRIMMSAASTRSIRSKNQKNAIRRRTNVNNKSMRTSICNFIFRHLGAASSGRRNLFLVLLILLLQDQQGSSSTCASSIFLSPDADQLSLDSADSASQTQAQQAGSWSHWWSYDGISGPDYWNINKHWRLCSLGRKQSPINIRTERLLYDHLLGPLELDWRPSGGHQLGGEQAQQQRQRQQASASSSSSSFMAGDAIASANAEQGASEQQAKTIPVRLINSGRGIEAWLERASPFDSSQLADGATAAAAAAAPETTAKTHAHNHHHHHHHAHDTHKQQPLSEQQQRQRLQLVLAGGPLAYEYQLFKIELHSTATYATSAPATFEQNDEGGGGGDDSASSPEAELSSRQSSQASGAKSSEHLINGRSFEAELQLHFYNRHLASGAREALRMANEQPLASLFAVISVFISLRNGGGVGGGGVRDEPRASGDQAEATKETTAATTTTTMMMISNDSGGKGKGKGEDSSEQQNSRTSSRAMGAEQPLDFLLDHLDELQNQGDSLELKISQRNLDVLLTDTHNYVTYQGSMNRPPCAENVDWIILNKALRLHGRLLRTSISNLRASSTSSSLDRRGQKSNTLGSGATKCATGESDGLKVTPSGCDANATMPDAYGRQYQRQQQRQQQQHCSMKPSYIYQYSYATTMQKGY